MKLLYEDFAYNMSPTYATTFSPFELLYGENPRMPTDSISFHKDEIYHVDAKEKAQGA